MGIPRQVMTAKDEVKAHEYQRIESVRPDLIGPRNLVDCPKNDFKVVSTDACTGCGFWLGFFPKDRHKPLGPGNAWSVCAHPMGREVFTV